MNLNLISPPTKFTVYRCPDPVAVQTDWPWFNADNVCPCEPSLSNVTGRGFTPCTFGIQEPKPLVANNAFLEPYVEKHLKGNLYQDKQFTPIQLQPRPIARIGQVWRSAN